MYKGFYENFCILVDTREKKYKHLTDVWDKKKIKWKNKKLDSGDYSFEIDCIDFQNEIAIERKSSIDELCNNFAAGRERFKREFIRAKEKGKYIFLLIENATIQDIYNHNYKSRFNNKALLGSIKSWKEKYNIYVVFSEKIATADYIAYIFKRYIRNVLIDSSVKKGLIEITEEIK